jgi:hypothetical protein
VSLATCTGMGLATSFLLMTGALTTTTKVPVAPVVAASMLSMGVENDGGEARGQR